MLPDFRFYDKEGDFLNIPIYCKFHNFDENKKQYCKHGEIEFVKNAYFPLNINTSKGDYKKFKKSYTIFDNLYIYSNINISGFVKTLIEEFDNGYEPDQCIFCVKGNNHNCAINIISLTDVFYSLSTDYILSILRNIPDCKNVIQFFSKHHFTDDVINIILEKYSEYFKHIPKSKIQEKHFEKLINISPKNIKHIHDIDILQDIIQKLCDKYYDKKHKVIVNIRDSESVDKVEKYKKKYNEAQEEVEYYKNKYNNVKSEIKALKDIKSENEDHKETISALLKEIEDLKNENSKIEDEIYDRNDEISKLTKYKNIFDEFVFKLQNEEKIKNENEELRKVNRNIQKKLVEELEKKFEKEKEEKIVPDYPKDIENVVNKKDETDINDKEEVESNDSFDVVSKEE